MSRRLVAALGLLLLFLFASYLHFWPHFMTANEGIRLYFVQAVVDRGVPTVDQVLERYRIRNCDRAVHRGHSTLDKAPGLSYAAMPLYALLTRAGLSTASRQIYLLYHLLSLGTVGLLSLLGLLWLGRSILLLTGSEWASVAGALVVGLATPWALYSTLFFGHLPAAALAAGSLYYALARRPLASGAAAGAMVLVETTTLPLALGLLALLAARERRAAPAFLFCAGGLPFAALQLLHNFWLFDSPFTFGYSKEAEPVFAAIHGTGVFGFTWPRAEALLGITVGAKRGLFFHAPVLLLGVLGLAVLGRRPERRLEAWALGLLALGYTLFIGTFIYWEGGASYSARHLLPVVPLLGVGLGALLAAPPAEPPLHPAVRSLLLPTLTVFSFVATFAPLLTFPHTSPDFEMPLVQLSLPLLLEGHGVITLGQLAGLSPWWATALLPLAALALLPPLLSRLCPPRALLLRLVIGVAGAAALLGLVISGEPAETPAALRERVRVECLLGYPFTGGARCVEAGGLFDLRRGACSLLPKKI
jgi:hypothetical protein